MGATVTVDGLARLSRTLGKAGRDVEDLKDAHVRVAEVVIAAARVTGPRRSGRLVADLRPSRAKGRASVLLGRASVPYAGPIHWGWPARGIRPQPFVVDAARATEPEWVETYRREVQKILDRVEGA